MIHELSPDTFATARPIFDELGRLQVAVGAVLDQECDGRLIVDDSQRPRSAFLTTPEGTFLAGDPDNGNFNAALRRFVWDELFGRSGWEMLFATTGDPGWEERFTEMAAPRDVLRMERRHFTCHAPRLDWRPLVPDGFAVRPIDGALLDDANLAVPEHVRSWIGNNWGTRERYLERGFGFATVHEGAVVCWSLADCRSDDACEIGIRTHHAFRRRGLATVTAAAAVEHALKGDFRTVGWHANEDNVASIATAEKVGFGLDRRYVSLYFFSTEAEELAERGRVAFGAGRFDETVALYERVFELRPESPDFQYFLAARASAATGDTDMAIRHLNRAIDLGWSAADATAACPEFKSIHETPGWQAALERMAGGGG